MDNIHKIADLCQTIFWLITFFKFENWLSCIYKNGCHSTSLQFMQFLFKYTKILPYIYITIACLGIQLFLLTLNKRLLEILRTVAWQWKNMKGHLFYRLYEWYKSDASHYDTHPLWQKSSQSRSIMQQIHCDTHVHHCRFYDRCCGNSRPAYITRGQHLLIYHV